MAACSSILAWKIPWTEEPGGLQSMESQRVRHDWAHQLLRVIDKVIPLWESFPGSSVGKESACNTGDPSSILGLGRSHTEGIDYTLQCSWVSLVAQLVKNLPAMQETWVQSPGLGRFPRRREWLPTPVFWPGELHGLYCPGGSKELDSTEWLSLTWWESSSQRMESVATLSLKVEPLG